ncbi:MAG: substrate-binding domain-containing protein, partial [Verrucomicrobiota bacterium]
RIETRLDENYVASYLRYQRHYPPAQRIAPLITPVLTKPLLEEWLKKSKPDAILISYDKVIHDIMKWLPPIGFNVPQDLGVGLIMVPKYPHTFAGVDEHLDKVAIRAVDFLVNMMEHGERGIPENPIRLMVKGTWHPGTTLRRLTPSSS